MRETAKTIAAVLAVVLFATAGWYIYDALRERSLPEKLASIIHQEDARQLTSQLESYLADDSSRVRARAVLAIGRIGHPRSGQLLLDMLGDPSIDVAAEAAFALGLTSNNEAALPLLAIANDLPSAIVVEAVKAAGRLADSSMADVAAELTVFLSHPSPDVREATCLALFYAGGKQPVSDLIEFEAQEPDREVRLAALYALSRMGIDKASDVYIKYQADSDPHARMLAVRGLAACDIPDRARLLALSLNDSDNRVAAQAIAGLVAADDAKSAEYIAGKFERLQDEKLITAAIDGLRSLESKLGFETVMMHLRAGLSDNVTIAGVRYLAAIQKDRAVMFIDSLLYDNPKAPVRAACADAFGIIGRQNLVSRLAVLFADEDPMVRGSAFAALIEIDSTNLGFYLDQALADADPMSVVLAIDQIGQKKLTRYLPQMTTLMTARSGVDVDIRRSIVDAASGFFDEMDRDTTLMELLTAALYDPEYIVRRQAAGFYEEKFNEDRTAQIAPARTRISEREIKNGIERYGQNPYAVIVTSKGEVELELYFDVAPLTVLSFKELAETGFYDGLNFHRVVPNFVVQGGDPRGDGWGGPPYYIRCEYSDERYGRGTVGIATSGKDTGGSQFFITHSPQPHLDARYTIFGQVTSGMEVVDQLVKGDIIENILIRESL